MTGTFALRRVDHLLLVLQCCCVALVYVNLLCRYADVWLIVWHGIKNGVTEISLRR